MVHLSHSRMRVIENHPKISVRDVDDDICIAPPPVRVAKTQLQMILDI